MAKDRLARGPEQMHTVSNLARERDALLSENARLREALARANELAADVQMALGGTCDYGDVLIDSLNAYRAARSSEEAE